MPKTEEKTRLVRITMSGQDYRYKMHEDITIKDIIDGFKQFFALTLENADTDMSEVVYTNQIERIYFPDGLNDIDWESLEKEQEEDDNPTHYENQTIH